MADREIVMDRGSEFAAEVRKMLNKEYPIKRKLITTRNPQANKTGKPETGFLSHTCPKNVPT
jgi:hypothetical protein